MDKVHVQRKITDPEVLSGLIKKANGKRIILTGGIFDFLKPYHIDLFDFAKSHGDILIVAVESADVYTSAEERLEILEAVGNIDILFLYENEKDIEKIGSLVSEVIFNSEFGFSGDKILFKEKVINFPV